MLETARQLQVTVAVVSWNTRELLAECLQSLHEDVVSGQAEVWVVDNASSDGSAEMVRAQFPWASLISSQENLGFGPAVNLVANQTSSPWIAPANADTRMAPGALRRLVAAGASDPTAGVIAPRLVLPDGQTQRSAYPFPTLGANLMYLAGAARLSPRLASRWALDGTEPEPGAKVPWAVGAFLLVRRAAWDEIGGFDAGLWMYAEDLDLGWRMHRAGWVTRYEPRATVYHEESAATRQAWGGERFARWHASTYAWLARRRGLAFARLISLLNVFGFSARALLSTLPALCGLPKARHARRNAINAVRAHATGLRSSAWLKQVR
jgi:N-acetylglucosaminyl-diphospho-decaprenol L-rhamnosyltransferase